MNAEQDRRLPLTARCQHLFRTYVTVPMQERAHIFGLVAAHLPLVVASLGALGARSLARRHPAPFAEVIALEKAAQRGIGRHWPQFGPRLTERHQIVVVKPGAPALVGDVLRQYGLAYGVTHDAFAAGIGTPFTAQPADWIIPLSQGDIEPS